MHDNVIIYKNKNFLSFFTVGYFYLKFFLKKYKHNFNRINNIFRFYVYFFLKFSYTGKSYKVYKQNKKLLLIFNRSHITWLYFKDYIISLSKLKTKFKFKFLLKKDIGYVVGFLKKIRKQNVFTKRGIHINKLVFFKKKGKISQYRLVM